MHLSSLQHVERLVKKYLADKAQRTSLTSEATTSTAATSNFSTSPTGTTPVSTSSPTQCRCGVDFTLSSAPAQPQRRRNRVRPGVRTHSILLAHLAGNGTSVETRRHDLLLAPSRGYEHRHPQDCWRFYPDSYHALANYADMKLLEVNTDWEPHPDSAPWGDTVGVFKQPDMSTATQWRRRLMQQIRYLVMPGYK